MHALVTRVHRVIDAAQAYLVNNTANAEQTFIAEVLTQLDTPSAVQDIKDAEWSHDKEAQKTKSNQYFGKLVPKGDIKSALMDFIAAANQIDKIKKALFYGRDYEPFTADKSDCYQNCYDLPLEIAGDKHRRANDFNDAVDILHAILGSCTESGEKAELLIAAMDGQPFDKVGYVEETGDGRWYDCIGLNAVGYNTRNCDMLNSVKLQRKRFKKAAFTTEEAINRDHAEERKTLESAVAANTSDQTEREQIMKTELERFGVGSVGQRG